MSAESDASGHTGNQPRRGADPRAWPRTVKVGPHEVRIYRDKLPSAEVEKVEAEVKGAREALYSDDAAALKAAFDKLQAARHQLAQAAYQGGAGGAEQTGGAPEGGAGGDDDVIDAEYEEA